MKYTKTLALPILLCCGLLYLIHIINCSKKSLASSPVITKATIMLDKEVSLDDLPKHLEEHFPEVRYFNYAYSSFVSIRLTPLNSHGCIRSTITWSSLDDPGLKLIAPNAVKTLQKNPKLAESGDWIVLSYDDAKKLNVMINDQINSSVALAHHTPRFWRTHPIKVIGIMPEWYDSNDIDAFCGLPLFEAFYQYTEGNPVVKRQWPGNGKPSNKFRRFHSLILYCLESDFQRKPSDQTPYVELDKNSDIATQYGLIDTHKIIKVYKIGPVYARNYKHLYSYASRYMKKSPFFIVCLFDDTETEINAKKYQMVAINLNDPRVRLPIKIQASQFPKLTSESPTLDLASHSWFVGTDDLAKELIIGIDIPNYREQWKLFNKQIIKTKALNTKKPIVIVSPNFISAYSLLSDNKLMFDPMTKMFYEHKSPKIRHLKIYVNDIKDLEAIAKRTYDSKFSIPKFRYNEVAIEPYTATIQLYQKLKWLFIAFITVLVVYSVIRTFQVNKTLK